MLTEGNCSKSIFLTYVSEVNFSQSVSLLMHINHTLSHIQVSKLPPLLILPLLKEKYDLQQQMIKSHQVKHVKERHLGQEKNTLS